MIKRKYALTCSELNKHKNKTQVEGVQQNAQQETDNNLLASSLVYEKYVPTLETELKIILVSNR